MLNVFLITFPFFALIAAGYAAARRGVLPLDAIPGLNIFVLYFALPCMLYRFGASTPVAQLLDASVALVWGAAGLSVVGGVVALSRRAGIGWNDASFGALVAAFPNTGFMGVPLLTAILGAQAAGPVIITIIFDMVITASLCIALSRLDGVEEHEAQRSTRLPRGSARGLGRPGAAIAVRQALGGVFVNPLPWAILLGALASALRFTLPAPVDRTVAMLADAASPAALFTIGAVLARSAMVVAASRRSDALHDVLPVVVVKLVVHPLLVFGLGSVAVAAGLPLAPSALLSIALVAALPSASNVSMLAERFGADNGRVARIILWTTVAAFFSFPLAVSWLR